MSRQRGMRIFRWIDKNLWSIPAFIFLAVEIAFSIWSNISRSPVMLAALSVAERQTTYSSIASTASAFFGAAVTVVAILVAFPKLTATPTEQALAHARTIVIGSLLMSSVFMLTGAVTATIGLAVDSRQTGNYVVATLVEASCIASAIGLLVGGVGLAYIIVDRSRH